MPGLGREHSARSPFKGPCHYGVGPVVSVSLSPLSPEILSGFLVGSGSGSPGFARGRG